MHKSIFIISVLLLFQSITLHALDTGLIEQKIFKMVNAERKKHDLPTYKYHKKLEKLARYHSKNMVKYDFFSHTDHNGDSPAQRALNLVPQLMGGIGENIAYNYGFTEEEAATKLMKAWMNSPGHRKNILSSKYNYIGVGIVQKGERIYGTQNFGDLSAELIHISGTSFKYGEILKMRFKFLGDYNKSKLFIYIKFPDKSAKYYTKSGSYYTGGGKFDPTWTGSSIFEVNLKFKYGKGRYRINMGESPNYYKGFSFIVK